MEENVCESCIYFTRFYIEGEDEYYGTEIGECAIPRIAICYAESKSCKKYFQRKKPSSTNPIT